jgi:proteasome accessory factor B
LRVRKLAVNARSPRSVDFEVPAGFSLDAYVATWPWQHRFHPPISVDLELKGDLFPLAASLFPQAAGANGRFTVPATDLDGLLKYVLSLGSDARVHGPAEAAARFKELASRIAAAHQPKAVEPAPGATG